MRELLGERRRTKRMNFSLKLIPAIKGGRRAVSAFAALTIFRGYCLAQDSLGFVQEQKSTFELLMTGRFGNILLFVLGALGLILLVTNSNSSKTTSNESRTALGMICFAVVIIIFIYRINRRFYWYGRG
jgi:hypothetical protein